MSSAVLKIIACIFMLIDHIGFCFFPNNILLRCIGRLAFPIFAFQIAKGYTYTHSKKKYMMRMLLFALISQLPYLFFRSVADYSDFRANIGFTFFIALLCLFIIDIYQEKKKVPILLLLLPLIFSSYLLKAEYSSWGVFFVILFYLFDFGNIHGIHFKNVFFFFIIEVYLTSIYIVLSHTSIIQYYCLLAIPLLVFYNGKKGANIKYLFYVFYPLHFLLLGAIHYFFF